MIKTIFKGVGNGDSIILEWMGADGTLNVGIVDCNLFGKSNPVIQHLETLMGSHKELTIAFVVLSHPHYDHYSGLTGLLEFLQKKQMAIHHFLHTIPTHIPSVNFFARTLQDKGSALFKMLSKVRELFAERLIHDGGTIRSPLIFYPDPRIRIECLSPSNIETQVFIDEVLELSELPQDDLLPEQKRECHVAANRLSTIFKVSFQEHYILLTSDSESGAFEKLLEKPGQDSTVLHLCQIPHHGSGKSYNPLFWAGLRKKDNCPAVFSVGCSNSYGHPDPKVVEQVKALNYLPTFTFREVDQNNAKIQKIRPFLDMVSTRVNSREPCDQEFTLTV
jgi:competence protein ComEC